MKFLNPILVMDGRTDGKAQSNMPLIFFKVGGIKTAQMVLSAELKGIQGSRCFRLLVQNGHRAHINVKTH